jgi:hypothetical protein
MAQEEGTPHMNTNLDIGAVPHLRATIDDATMAELAARAAQTRGQAVLLAAAAGFLAGASFMTALWAMASL